MITRRPWQKFVDHPLVEWALLAVGVILLIVSPLVGAIPGPGGIIVAGLGLALILKTSMWAKRRYVRFKRLGLTIRGRRLGELTDLALRRPSAQRREAIRKAEKTGRAS